MTLVYLTVAWMAGIVLARWLEPPSSVLTALTLAGLVAILGLGRSAKGRLGAVLAVMALLGAWRYLMAQPAVNGLSLARYNDRGQVSLQGTISAEPTFHSTYIQLELEAEELDQDGVRHPVRGKVVLNVPLYPPCEYGDRLLVAGLLETPPMLDDVSYREYLASRGVHSMLRQARVSVRYDASSIRPPDGRFRWDTLFLRQVYRWKRSLRSVLETILPNPDAGLLAGILLGLGYTLPDDLAQAFRAVGLTHIIVISGTNVSLVVQAVMLATRRVFSRRWALWISLGAIALFALFVGPSTPVLRAVYMGGLFILGQTLGRRSHALTTLAATALVMSAANPLLLGQVSFQLSFVATLSLIALEPALARVLATGMASKGRGDRPSSWLCVLRDVFLTTLAAQLLTLPIIAYHFGEISLISLLSNILVLPTQPALMFAGFLALAIGALWLPAGLLAGWLVWPLTRYCLLVIQGLASLPWASMQFPRIGWGVVMGFYALLALTFSPSWREKGLAFMRGLFQRTRATAAVLTVLALSVLLVWVAVGSLPDGRLHVYFLDVGQGDAILLRTPGGRVILVDGGPDPLLLTSRLGQILPFWQRRIDLLIVTHADQDHLLGLLPVLDRYRVAQVLEPPLLDESALTVQWREALAASGARVLPLSRGMQVTLGRDLRLEALHPPPATEGLACEGNRCSLVLRAVMGRCRLLLAGDIDARVEEELRAAGLPLGATLLKVAHHGAASATSAEFLAVVQPQLAVISVGRDNRFGHPADEVLRRLAGIGCRVLRTDLQGTVELITDGRNLWVKCHGPSAFSP